MVRSALSAQLQLSFSGGHRAGSIIEMTLHLYNWLQGQGQGSGTSDSHPQLMQTLWQMSSHESSSCLTLRAIKCMTCMDTDRRESMA